MKRSQKEKGRFINFALGDTTPTFFDFFKWRMFGKHPGKSEQITKQIPFVYADKQKLYHPEQRQVTWLGHSSIFYQDLGMNILMDPVFSKFASPLYWVGPKRLVPFPISVKQMPEIDIVFISHNHYDHLDLWGLRRLKIKHIVVPLGLKAYLNKKGFHNVQELDWLDQSCIGNATFTCLPAQHWSKRGIFDNCKTLWCSWLLNVGDYKFWFAGDTGYHRSIFKSIGDTYGPIDFACIPIGSYEPRWFMKLFHVNPDEAALIHKEIKSKYSLGIHHSTFVLSDEAILDPIKKLHVSCENLNLNKENLITIPVGKTIKLI